ncbi:hypothetical protein [Lentibacillus salinarum]|uniref:Uncharacterized protein n=1 Tax=Lentibacillus salinarum TaxID=446820 RepID=A0ABW3ZXD8_9BACI
MSERLKLKCPSCHSNLKLSEGYTGCDWNCEKGEGSNYDWEISLDCTNDRCAYVFALGHIKEIGDFSPAINKPYEV